MTITNASAHFTYPIDFMECSDKIVVIIIWGPICPPEDGRRVVQLVKEHLKTVMSRRKNYVNRYRQEVNFLVEDRAYLQTTPIEETKHFHVKGKLTPRFIGLSKITSRQEIDGYQLELPPELPMVHNIFHASQLRKCFQLPN